MTEINKFDIKQLILAIKKIQLFELSKINLQELISDLRGILYAFESIKENIKEEIQRHINNLELVNDSFRDGSEHRLRESAVYIINFSVKTLKKIINTTLNNYLNTNNSSVTSKATVVDDWLICANCIEAFKHESINVLIICPNCYHIMQDPRHVTFR